jgi:acetyl esterase
LAAIVAQQLRDIVHHQVLLYPAIPTASKLSTSYIQNMEAPLLTARMMAWFYLRYFSTVDELNSPLACPLKFDISSQTSQLDETTGSQTKLPPALIVTAEFDILRDEGEYYGAHLHRHGQTAVTKRYNNTVHGFAGVWFIKHGSQVIEDIANHLIATLGSPN